MGGWLAFGAKNCGLGAVRPPGAEHASLVSRGIPPPLDGHYPTALAGLESANPAQIVVPMADSLTISADFGDFSPDTS